MAQPAPQTAPQAAVAPSWGESARAVLLGVLGFGYGISPLAEGYYDRSLWAPVSLGLLIVFTATIVARGPVLSRRGATALLALCGLWVLSLISVTWADSADQALVGAARWLSLAAPLGLFLLLLPGTRHGAAALLWGAGLGLAAVVAFLLATLVGGDVAGLFYRRRLHEPLEYANGTASYLMMAFWLFAAAAERVRPVPLAAPAAALAVLAGGLALLTQSRAIVPVVVVTVLVMLVVVPGRRRRAWLLVLLGAALASVARPLLDVYDKAPGQSVIDVAAAGDAAGSLLVVALLAGVAWGIVRLVRDTVERSGSETGRRLVVWSVAPLAVVALAAVAIGATRLDDPVARVERAIDQVQSPRVEDAGDSRFRNLGSNRFQYWRVAVEQFETRPWRGVGAGNFDRTYFLDRRTTEDVRQAHSIELQALGELGLPGGLLVAAFIGAVFVGLVRAGLAGGGGGSVGVVAGSAGVFVTWIAHTSVDWIHLIPGVSGVALAGAAVLLARSRPNPAPRGGRSLLVLVPALALVLAGAALSGTLTLADRAREQARERLATDPRQALEDTERSLQINPTSLPSLYVRAAAFARLGDYRRSRATLRLAAEKEPFDFAPWVLLGDLETRRGREARALAAYRRAAQLNPLDPVIAELAEDGA